VVAPDGTASVERNRDGGGDWHGTIEDYGTDGGLEWSFSMSSGEVAYSSHTLDTNGTIYFATNMQRLFAIDSSTGSLLWQTDLPTLGPMYQGVLALTPAGSLIASASRELFSIYAGAPLATSPWPRFRGTNANASCPSPSSASPSSSP
jgi:outer membrane protein assembly factor BamB